MFRYYQRASKCYVYLSDVPDEIDDVQAFRASWDTAFRQSRWFTRGWTLQELLAPPVVEFFSKDGVRLGSKISLEQEVHEITQIPLTALRGQNLADFSIEDRMSWTAGRTTTFKEDEVYCLLGIFGVFLPLLYGEGKTYATGRLKDEIARRQQGRGTQRLQDLAVFSMLPFLRNEQFVGRERQLQALDQFLLLNTHQRLSIYGLGGCGKSALVLEFAYRALAQDPERMVFWIPAMSQESFELAYQDIGNRLCVPGINDDNANVKQLVKQALSSQSMRDWLLIIDNADDSEILIKCIDSDRSARLLDYLPNTNNGKILFTTRSRKAAGELTPGNALELNDMNDTEARQLLNRRIITRPAVLKDAKAVSELLETLANLPLAIVQAAAFINNNDISIAAYIALVRTTGTDMDMKIFEEQFEDPGRYREMG